MINKNRESTKVLISVPKEFLKLLDEQADLEHRSRSELIREAIRVYIKNNNS